MEDFSLIILCKGQRHLLPLTLDTLRPQSGCFEVLLLGLEGANLNELADRYPELSLRIHDTPGQNLAEMMNEGLGLARGKYIQFLEPGDRYISQHGLEYLHTLIQNEPHLIYANSITSGAIAPSDFITARSPWFLKKKVFELGGFNRHLTLCPSMDLLCRLFQDRKTQAVFCRRVLIESETQAAVSLKEICAILYRHFGFWRALKWMFLHDKSQILRRTAIFIKEAFWQNRA